MDAEREEAISAALRAIRDRVGDILADSPTCGGPAGDILRALGRIEDAVTEQDSNQPRNVSGAGAGDLRSRNKPKRYIRETVGGQEVLAEYRHDSSTPLRSPKEILFTVADVLAVAAESLSFAGVQAGLAKRYGQEPPAYQARIALRFLQSNGIGQVARRQAHYAAIDSRRIQRATKKAWEALEE